MPLADGLVNLRITQRQRIATCEEVGCEWFLNGAEGMDEGLPFTHPAGVRCGDTQRCPHPNCPCPQRQPHLAIREDSMRFIVNNRGSIADVYHEGVDCSMNCWCLKRRPNGLVPGDRETVPDEWLQRTAEGVETITFIQKRGL